jgi:hypothetical protein
LGLFDEPLAEIAAWREERRASGELRSLPYDPVNTWPVESSLVLREDTALELGATGRSSLSLLLWTERRDLVPEDAVLLLGGDLSPQLAEDAAAPLAFGQLVLVLGRFPDEYDAYRDLRDVVYETRASGVSTRVWPDRLQLWSRVSRRALQEGFTLEAYGNAIIKRLREREEPQAAQVAFILGRQEELDRLRPAAEKARDVVDALIKMYEEMNFDCESCEYLEVCDEVAELRLIRDRLKGERQGEAGERPPGKEGDD